MTLKMKLTASISAFVLVLGLMLMGIMAVNQATVNMGGSISFTATDVYAHITGSIANDTSSPSDLDVTYSAEETTGDPTVWNDLNLAFDSQATPIEVTITVENLSAQNTLRVNLNDKLSSTIENFEKVVQNDGETYTNHTDITLQPNGQENDSTTFTIIMSITNKNNSLTADFDYELNLFDQNYVGPQVYDYLNFEENGDGTVELDEFNEDLAPSTDIIVPATVSKNSYGEWIEGNDYTVTAIGSSAFYSCDSLESIDLSGCKDMTLIDESAFHWCSNLASITLPSNLLYIDSSVFIGCINLTSITLPSSLISIGVSAFNGCRNLKEIDFSGCASLEIIDEGAFSFCDGLINVDLSSCTNLKEIGYYAFEDCYSLASIILPSSLEIINEDAFNSCRGLTRVDLSNCTSLTSIGSSAFSGCSSLKSINFSGCTSLEIIDEEAFYGCSDLVGKLDLINCRSLTSIEQSAFENCYSLTSITLPSSLTSVDNRAFDGCYALAEVYNYSPNITVELWYDIGQYAKVVYNASDLTGEKPASKIQTIGNVQYYIDGKDFVALAPSVARDLLTTITLDSRTTEINQCAFIDFLGLTSITLPSSLKSIGDYAFDGCCVLVEVYNYSENVEVTLGNTNYNVNGYLGEYAKVIYNSSELTGEYPASKIQTINSVQYYVQGDDFIALGPSVARNSLTTLTLDSRTTEIRPYAFKNCTSLIRVDLSNCISLTSIGSYAFNECSRLKGELDLSNCTSLASIGSYAFNECSRLNSVTLPSSLTSVGDRVFYYCSEFTRVDLSNCTSLTNIGSAAFGYLEKVRSVTINQYVFENVTSSSFSCGNLLNNISSGETVLVPANLIDDLHLTNSYLDDESEFTRSATANEDGYYVYTKI